MAKGNPYIKGSRQHLIPQNLVRKGLRDGNHLPWTDIATDADFWLDANPIY